METWRMRGSAQPREHLGRHFREQDKSQGPEGAGQGLGWRGRPVWPEPRVVGDGVGRGRGEAGSVGSWMPQRGQQPLPQCGSCVHRILHAAALGRRREGGWVCPGVAVKEKAGPLNSGSTGGRSWSPRPALLPSTSTDGVSPWLRSLQGPEQGSPRKHTIQSPCHSACPHSQRQIFKHANQNMPGLPHPPWLRLALRIDPKALCSPPRPPLCLADPQIAHLPPHCPNAPLPHPQPLQVIPFKSLVCTDVWAY